MYREVTEALQMYNGQRDTLRDLLSFNVTTACEDVIQRRGHPGRVAAPS